MRLESRRLFPLRLEDAIRSLLATCAAAALLVVPLASPAGGPPPLLREKCGETYGVEAQPFWLTASDGVQLYAIEAGTGPLSVVLSHEFARRSVRLASVHPEPHHRRTARARSRPSRLR